jgi:hypothetical protein
MIRQATMGDVPAILDLLREGYERSKYRGRGEIDARLAKQKLHFMIPRSGLRGDAGTWCNVVQQREGIVGLHFAVKNPIAEIGTKLFASDVWFYCSKTATPFAVAALLESFEVWAQADEKIIEIRLGVHDTFGNDFERVAKLYEARGYRQVGRMYERAIERAGKAA